MPAGGKKNKDIDDLTSEYGRIFSGFFDYLIRLFDTLNNVFNVLEKAFDDIPIIRPLVLLAIIGMLVYYVVFFRTFNARDMLLFIYFFIGGIVLLALMVAYKFAEIFEPYLIYRAARRKSREENQKILETHRLIRQVVKKNSEHKEITANDVLVPAKDRK